MRRFSDPPYPGIRYRHRPGAYGIILSGRAVLFALNESPGEEFALPGGGIDPGETPVRALHREAMEETGHRIQPLRRIGAYRRFTYMPEYDMQAEKICHIYLCRAGRQIAAPSEPDHHPLWLTATDAAEMASIDGDRVLLRAVLRQIGLLR
jgi:8-oxo-dGTP diphosphatase